MNGVQNRVIGSGNITRFIQSNNGEYAFLNSTQWSDTFATLALYAGTGNTPVTSSDYAITNPNAGLTVVMRTNTFNENNKNPDPSQDYIGIFTVTYRNDTESDITVSEMGLIGNFPNVSIWYVLAARELLETPITIAPGEAYTFTMYIG